jgi:hypothetical protein
MAREGVGKLGGEVMTDLDKLIEAIESGEMESPPIGKVFGISWKTKWASAAYHGSLDAAKALHEALLPEHTRDVDATSPELGICVRIWSPDGPIVGAGDKECEARSWLIAILKAYRAQVVK